MTLRPLDRQTLKPAPGRAAERQKQIPVAPTLSSPAQEHVSQLAQDSFISRSYELKNPANMGQGLDGTVRYISAIGSDLEGLTQPDLTVGTGIALTGKLIRDVSGVAVNSGRVLEGLSHAHISLVRTAGGYQAAASSLDRGIHKVSKSFQPIIRRVERFGAIGSVGMATIALPSLAVSAVKRNTAAVRTMVDPKATNREQIEAVKDAAYTNAALAYTAVAVPSAIKTLATTGTATSAITRMAASAQKTGAYKTSTKAAGFVTPVADATLFFADGLHLYTTMTDPSATGKAKARAALNLTLDALKLGMYACPKTRGVQLAYTAVGVTQLGVAVYSVVRPEKP